MQATVLTLNHMNDLEQMPGDLLPANTVMWAAYMALRNSQGNPVRVIISNDPVIHPNDLIYPGITPYPLTYDGVRGETYDVEVETDVIVAGPTTGHVILELPL